MFMTFITCDPNPFSASVIRKLKHHYWTHLAMLFAVDSEQQHWTWKDTQLSCEMGNKVV